MKSLEEMRKLVLQQGQGALALDIGFMGVVGGLLKAVDQTQGTVEAIAKAAQADAGYVRRWCEAAFAFEYVDEHQGTFQLTELGRAFLPETPGTLMPFAIMAVLGAHMVERATGLLRTGERPGESVLGERATVLPWFGPMLEASFADVFEKEVLPRVKAFERANAAGGVVLDLGCGNGWYLRRLAAHFPKLRGIGLDGFAENIEQATAQAQAEGLGARLSFQAGDVFDVPVREPADVIVMNRALHHVWDRKAATFAMLKEHLKPGGSAVIWEPNWPDSLAALRDPRRKAMAFQNLSEHVQGNHFLRAEEIAAAFREGGLTPEVQLFGEGGEALVIGTRAG